MNGEEFVRIETCRHNGQAVHPMKSNSELSLGKHVLPGDTVLMHYAVKMEDGTVLTSTEEEGPFTFIHGQQDVLPVVQEAVLGMTTGESKIVHVSKEAAYGPYKPELVTKVDRLEFDTQGIKPEMGLELRIGQPDGESTPLRVTAFDDATVTLDANHPLAGYALIFDLLVIDILRKPATEGDLL
jgi:peptidylprolyl isomerase